MRITFAGRFGKRNVTLIYIAPKKLKQYHHGDLKAALLSAALSLIERDGVKGFNLKDAAVLVGVSTAAPYRHFADKDALLAAIRKEAFVLFYDSLKEAYESGRTPAARIEELGVAYVLFALHNPGRFRVMFGLTGEPAPVDGPAEPNAFLLLVEAVAALVPRAGPKRRGDVVLACWSIVHGFAALQMDGAFARLPQPEMEQQLRRTLRLLIEPLSGS
jgi:AcrR family transcriptional regulator